MALFTCSFDAASPFAPWSFTSGVSIVPGRDANGCQLANIGFSILGVSGAFGSTLTAGLAFNPQSFANSVCLLSDASGGVGAPFANIDNEGDGRMVLTIGASGLGSLTTSPFDGFVQNIGIWGYYEISVVITMVVTPVDGTHSNLSMTVAATLHVNNNLIGTVSNTWLAFNLLNTTLPAGVINDFQIRQNLSIVDDVYINATRIGDCFVASDDSTITVETSAPDVTQALFEIGLVDPITRPDVTQALYEVGLGGFTSAILLTFDLKVSETPGQGPIRNPIQCINQEDDDSASGVPGSGGGGPNPPPPPPPPPDPNVPVITTLSLPGGTINFFYAAFRLMASGVGPFTWAATGVPAGMFLSIHGDLVGTPTVSGTFSVVITARNAGGSSAPVTLPLVIGGLGVAPTMTSVNPLPPGNVGTPYSFQFTATGTLPLSWSALIFAGMNFDPATAIFTWPVPVAGTVTINVRAANGAGDTGSLPFVLTISAVPLPPPPPTPPGG